jgi:rfaE bifunctional protein nucleotidyltransferase chain/domain
MNSTDTDPDGLAQLQLLQKILPLDELAVTARDLRNDGRRVVLAHGVFDLLHIGHIRHLKQASSHGDALVVTITSDAFVNKGPDRPVFRENLRAEALAALETVDYVAISDNATAESAIQNIRPDVYVKGVEYAEMEKDITGNIAREIDLVESYGGKVVFTEDITFSSSSLINEYLDVHDPNLKEYLAGLRNSGMDERVHELVEAVSTLKVTLVGDAIIDEYQYVQALGKSPKENMIATLYENKEIFAGGVIAAANHIAEFCAEVQVICTIGSGDDGYEDLIRSTLKPNVRLSAVILPNVPTTRKCRFIDVGYGLRKLFEVYFMDDRPVQEGPERELLDLIDESLTWCDLAVVTDFGHGLMTENLVQLLADRAPFLSVNAQSNSANLGFNLITKYPRADYICIDQPEARLAVHDNQSDVQKVASDLLPKSIDCPRIIVTAGRHGCISYRDGEGTSTAPALSSNVVDSVGAGDAFFAVSAPFLSVGATMQEASFLGNVAGAMKIGIVGHRSSVEKIALIKFVTTLLK